MQHDTGAKEHTHGVMGWLGCNHGGVHAHMQHDGLVGGASSTLVTTLLQEEGDATRSLLSTPPRITQCCRGAYHVCWKHVVMFLGCLGEPQLAHQVNISLRASPTPAAGGLVVLLQQLHGRAAAASLAAAAAAA